MVFSFINEEFGKGTVIAFMIFLTAMLIAAWYWLNYPPLQQTAQVFFILGSIGMFGHLFGLIVKEKEADFDTILYDDENISGPWTPWALGIFILVCIGIGLFVFFSISGAGAAIYDAPTFQVIDLGPLGSALGSFVFAVIEGTVFIGLLFGVIFFFAGYLTENKTLAVIISIISVPVIYAFGYHILVYGFTNLPATLTIFSMFLISTVICYLAKNLIFEWLFHGFNNAGIVFFREAGVTPLVLLYQNFLFILGFIFLVIVIGFYKLRHRGG